MLQLPWSKGEPPGKPYAKSPWLYNQKFERFIQGLNLISKHMKKSLEEYIYSLRCIITKYTF